MQTLPRIDAPTVRFSSPAQTSPNYSLAFADLQKLGERLRVAYGPVEAPLPARLAELVERLAQREQPKD
ncbi:hypothetical protein [Microvirga aerophila]|uniref:Anti-sigma factor NepR domain-containing protein n=1 Tax=Microvirga aerophila TaxID=670291 RepID=A0A512C486_9HYPH|nr:hypothetical protein [Microvirga aerophila]GEO19015.1 hypothetical protein MAE02_67110 [Microvirga aerophila]